MHIFTAAELPDRGVITVFVADALITYGILLALIAVDELIAADAVYNEPDPNG